MNIADKLKYARDKIHLTGSQVESATGIGRSSLSEYEKGVRAPSLSQLRSLAQIYNRSVAFFLDDSPIPKEIVLWRERPTENAENIETRFLQLCEQYRNLEILCDDIVLDALPKPTRDIVSYDNAELLAQQVRRELELGERPGGELLRILEEQCGVKVFHLQFEPTGTAASAKSDCFGSAILLNGSNVSWRRNFDLAHELFHLLTWEMFRSDKDETSIGAPDNEERLATCFARNLLMPSNSVKDAVYRHNKSGKMTFADLYDIAREFDVSIDALLWQFHFIFNKGPQDKQETQDLITKAKEQYNIYETRENIPFPERPLRFKALAVAALRKGVLSIGRFAEYMGIRRVEALEYLKQEAGDIEQIQITAA